MTSLHQLQLAWVLSPCTKICESFQFLLLDTLVKIYRFLYPFNIKRQSYPGHLRYELKASNQNGPLPESGKWKLEGICDGVERFLVFHSSASRKFKQRVDRVLRLNLTGKAGNSKTIVTGDGFRKTQEQTAPRLLMIKASIGKGKENYFRMFRICIEQILSSVTD